MVRWGLPSSSQALFEAATRRAERLRAKGQDPDFNELLRMEPDGGTTNVRNIKSRHWTRWLGLGNSCLVPVNSFCELDQASGSKQNTWFALGEDRPLACFAGMWVPAWESVRKIKEGLVTCDLFGFHTCDPNDEVKAIHPKAMPVILLRPEEFELWMTAPAEEAMTLRRPPAARPQEPG